MKAINSKSYFKNFILFFAILISVDFLTGIILKSMFKNGKSGIVSQENYIFNKTKEDILIFGSSRAAFQYIPSEIEKELNISCFNAGREGVGIYFHYASLLATLNRYKPKLVLLDLDFRDVYMRGGNFGESVFIDLAPYYGTINDSFDNYITRNWYDKLLYSSNLIKYNKKLFGILTSNFSNENNFIKGYKPLKGEWNLKRKKLNDEKFDYSEDLIKTIDLFIKTLKKNDIKLVIVVSPTNKTFPKRFFEIPNHYNKVYNIPFYNFYNDDFFNKNRNLFYDEEHLNEKGSLIFTKKLIELLKKNTY